MYRRRGRKVIKLQDVFFGARSFLHQLFMSIVDLSLPSVRSGAFVIHFFSLLPIFLTLARGVTEEWTLSNRVTKFIIFKYYTSMLCLLSCFCQILFWYTHFDKYHVLWTIFFVHGIRQSHEHTFQCPYHCMLKKFMPKIAFLFSQACIEGKYLVSAKPKF